MKRKSFILSVFAIIIISSLSVFTVLYFVNPLIQDKNSPSPDINSKNISDVIKVTDLKEVFTKTKTSKPTSQEILDFVKFYNNDRNIHWDDISVNESTISENSASLVAYNSDYYHGSVEVTYDVNDIIDLKSIFIKDQFNLGDIFLAPEEIITNNKILAKLAIIAPECDQDHIKLLNLNGIHSNVLLIDDDLKYQGHIVLTFNIQRSTISLDTKLVDKQLGIIKTNNWDDTPTKTQILEAIKAKPKNQDLNLNLIEINKITSTSAEISGIGYYQGIVTVTYEIDMKIELKTHLTNKELGNILITQADANRNNFYNVLLFHTLELNENLLVSVITIKDKDNLNLNSTSAIIIPFSDKMDEPNYIGKVEVTFKFQLVTK